MNYDEVRNLMTYDKATGICRWKERKGHKFFNTKYAGKTMGTVHKGYGYVCVKTNKKTYFLHRLIWLYMTGEMPKVIDHINHDRSDNKWVNLRDVKSYANNSKNRSRFKSNWTGYSGVTFNKCYKKKPWCARIGIGNKRVYLGSFKTKEEAIEAKKLAEVKYGFHRNHNCVR